MTSQCASIQLGNFALSVNRNVSIVLKVAFQSAFRVRPRLLSNNENSIIHRVMFLSSGRSY